MSGGSLRAIWIKRAKLGPMDARDRARLVVGRGLEGNADQGGRRQVTVISAEAWADAERDVGVPVDPRARRANLLVGGVDLEARRGSLLAIGDCRLRVGGECRGCYRMDEAQPGLRKALEPDWRAGIFAMVEAGGEIAVGDPVRWLDDEPLTRQSP